MVSLLLTESTCVFSPSSPARLSGFFSVSQSINESISHRSMHQSRVNVPPCPGFSGVGHSGAPRGDGREAGAVCGLGTRVSLPSCPSLDGCVSSPGTPVFTSTPIWDGDTPCYPPGLGSTRPARFLLLRVTSQMEHRPALSPHLWSCHVLPAWGPGPLCTAGICSVSRWGRCPFLSITSENPSTCCRVVSVGQASNASPVLAVP